jgi:hypothetical protein
MKVQDLLTDESKWLQHMAVDEGQTAWCLVGAISHCNHESAPYNAALERVRNVLRFSRLSIVDIVEWNDAPTTTFADIRRVIEQADI